MYLCSLFADEPKIVYEFPYVLEKRNGKDYIKAGKATLKYYPKLLKLNMENLFDGNKALSKYPKTAI